MIDNFKPQNTTELEQRAILLIGDIYRKHAGTTIESAAFIKALNIDAPQWGPLLSRLCDFGAIETYVQNGFQPHSHSIELAAEVRAHQALLAAPKDQVERIHSWVKTNPKTAWALIAFAVLLAALQLANSFLDLLIKIGAMHAPKP